MSVELETFKDPEMHDVELWAPDYSVSNVWLIQDYEASGGQYQRIDMSLDQLRELGKAIAALLGDKP